MTDESLAADGTREAFEELYGRYRRPVYQFLLRQVSDPFKAEDLFQQTFLKAFKGLATFRGRSTFKTWLYTIAHHCVIDQRRASATFDELTDLAAPAGADPVEKAEQIDLVKRAVASLPSQHKTLFLLVRYHDMKIAEAGEVVGLTPGSAKVTLLRVQRKLGEMLEKVKA